MQAASAPKSGAEMVLEGSAPEATSSTAQPPDSPQGTAAGSRCAPMSPMWVAMSQRFKENVSALKSRQGRKSYSGRPLFLSEGYTSLAARRQSLKRGPSPCHIGQAAAGRVERGNRPSIQPNLSKGRASRASRGQMPPLQPLPTPEAARPKKRRVEVKQGEAGRRSGAARPRQSQGKASEESLEEGSAGSRIDDAVAQVPTPAAQAPTPELEPCDVTLAFSKKRLRSKTPDPGDGRCRQERRKRLSRKSSPSVERVHSGCLTDPVLTSRGSARVSDQRQVPASKPDRRRSSQPERSTSESRILKSYRVTWAWKLADMGFSDAQIDAAISQCSTQREAIEWLCHSQSGD